MLPAALSSNDPMMEISQKGQRYHFDVTLIGSGIAGLSYALELAQLSPQTKIALISKVNLGESNSRYAQGGIAAASQQAEAIQSHIQDTLAAADGLADPETTETILSAGADSIKFLVKHGVLFDANLAQEGGHSTRRIYHAGDYTGDVIIQSLMNAVKALDNVTIFEYHTAVNLIKQTLPHQPANFGEVVGAYILDERTSLIHTFLSQAVVLATGGAGKIYRYTSNSETATGDGIAMAQRAGARVGNMEFYQFHPTLLYHNDLNNFLITEALRGEGAHLLHPETQQRFMQKYAPKQMELATRDVVARAIFSEIEHSQHNFVYLDVRHLAPAFIKERFPSIDKALKKIGIDTSTDLIPVVPAAHYLCGGVLTNPQGKTDLHRLLAIGETAFTGLHGANRLASNSLLEGVVMARLAARETSLLLQQPFDLAETIEDWDSHSVVNLRRASQINAHWRGLRSEMSSYAGIIRTQAGLEDLLKLIQARREMVENYYWRHTITRDLLELRNIIEVAELITRAALKRTNSRGGHFREDDNTLATREHLPTKQKTTH